MTRSTGLAPDRYEARNLDRSEHNFRDAAFGLSTSDTIIQPVARLQDQGSRPSCVGNAFAACVDARRGGAPWASAVSIWREARRRQDEIENILDGTRLEYAVAGLADRGWDPYVDGEETDDVEAGLGAPDAGDDLADELFAHDKRAIGMIRYRISESGTELFDAVDAALENDLGVVFGTGVKDPYFDYSGDPDMRDLILGSGYLGGSENGHAQRVIGTATLGGATKVYYVQNSWGAWGGCHGPSGIWMPGCCIVSPVVLLDAWDVHVIQVHA